MPLARSRLWSDAREALVSEGLAGRFAAQLYGEAPEPWEDAFSKEGLADLAILAQARWTVTDYDHAQWFFGRGKYPCWAGYTLGYHLIGSILPLIRTRHRHPFELLQHHRFDLHLLRFTERNRHYRA